MTSHPSKTGGGGGGRKGKLIWNKNRLLPLNKGINSAGAGIFSNGGGGGIMGLQTTGGRGGGGGGVKSLSIPPL
jgi:hypothetical protein